MKLFKSENRRDAMESQKGFTLIELSIVLVIIGLLVGGVIKGKDLIDNTKVSKSMMELEAHVGAVQAYRERYGVNPLSDATNRFNEGAAATSELATHRLRFANLISYATGASTPTAPAGTAGFAQNAFGGRITFEPGSRLAFTNLSGLATDVAVCLRGVTSAAASAIDAKYDDGQPDTGFIRSFDPGTAVDPNIANLGNTPATNFSFSLPNSGIVCQLVRG